MKDILGREIPVGGAVVCMAIGRRSSGMHFGIQTTASSVLTLRGHKNASNRYWIENMSETELELYNKIVDKENKEKEFKRQEEENRRSLKAIPYKDLKFGYKYKDDRGDIYTFLGYCDVVVKKGDKETVKSGYVNLKDWVLDNITKDLRHHFIDTYVKWMLTKTRRRFVEEVGKDETIEEKVFKDDSDNNKLVFYNKYKEVYGGDTKELKLTITETNIPKKNKKESK